MHHSFSTLPINKKHFLRYESIVGDPNKPGVVFLGGFMSDMQGNKAVALRKFCIDKGYAFIRFDYMGHGLSSGSFEEGTIGLWKKNVLTVLDRLTQGNQILVGSSMGGWLMILAALARPERISGLIGIAAAPDFTEYLIWERLDSVQKQALLKEGRFLLHSEYGDAPYPITRELIEEGRKHLLLHQHIDISIPVRLLHGQRDNDVPCVFSQKLMEKVHSADVVIELIEDGDHRLSDERSLALLCHHVEDLVETLAKSV